MHPSVCIHKCALNTQERNATQPYPTRVTHWWQKLDHYKTAHRTKTNSHYFRSHRAFLQEVRRHLGNRNYRCAIHPLSRLAFYQDVVMMFVWAVLAVCAPMQAVFLLSSFNKPTVRLLVFIYTMRCLRVVLCFDIFLRFFRGYVVSKTQEIVLDLKRIRGHYLKTFFFFDMSAPASVAVNTLLMIGYDRKYVRLGCYQVNFLIAVRIVSVVNMMNMLLRNYQFRENLRTCLKFIIIATTAVHWWGCILKLITLVYQSLNLERLKDSWYSKYQRELAVFALGQQSEDGVYETAFHQDYIIHISVSACYFFGVEMTRFSTDDSIEMLALSWVLLTGLFFYVCAGAKVLEFFGEVNISTRKYEELILQATQYMRVRRFPQQLRQRLFKYYNYKYSRTFFHEDLILNGLSEHLRMEVVLYSSLHLINNLRVFKGLSRAAVGSVLAFLKPEIYLAKDTMMRVDQDTKQFYFMTYGTCSVQLLSNKEMLHREDGDVFGNAWEQIRGEHNVDFIYKIVAVEPCQVYILELEDLRYCCNRYPELLERFNIMATEGLKQTQQIYAAVMNERYDRGEGILQELRRKKILVHGRRRREANAVGYI